MNGLLDFLQGASNAAASNVSGPVDLISWLLRKGGVGGVIGQAPFGSSEWMAQQGLTKPTTGAAGLLGEAAGMAAPMVVAAKAPQIASGLLKVGDNIAAPMSALNMQRGAINIDALKEANPLVDFTLLQRGDGAPAELAKVVVPKGERGSGVGTKFMNDLSAAADADNALLSLSPSSDFGGNKKRLEEFYKRFGFVMNKGKTKDFSIWNSMYRNPGDAK